MTGRLAVPAIHSCQAVFLISVSIYKLWCSLMMTRCLLASRLETRGAACTARVSTSKRQGGATVLLPGLRAHQQRAQSSKTGEDLLGTLTVVLEDGPLGIWCPRGHIPAVAPVLALSNK